MEKEYSMGELAKESHKTLEQVKLKIEDVTDMIRVYKKQPRMPELDTIIEKLETELQQLKQEEAELSK